MDWWRGFNCVDGAGEMLGTKPLNVNSSRNRHALLIAVQSQITTRGQAMTSGLMPNMNLFLLRRCRAIDRQRFKVQSRKKGAACVARRHEENSSPKITVR